LMILVLVLPELSLTENQPNFWWSCQNPVWIRGPPPPQNLGSFHLAIAGAPRIDRPIAPRAGGATRNKWNKLSHNHALKFFSLASSS
jgi:hypothetical protein